MLNRGPTPRGIFDPKLLALSIAREPLNLVETAGEGEDGDKDAETVGGCGNLSGGTLLLSDVDGVVLRVADLVGDENAAGIGVDAAVVAVEGRLERLMEDFGAVGAAAADSGATVADEEVGRVARAVALEEGEERAGEVVGEFETAAEGVGMVGSTDGGAAAAAGAGADAGRALAKTGMAGFNGIATGRVKLKPLADADDVDVDPADPTLELDALAGSRAADCDVESGLAVNGWAGAAAVGVTVAVAAVMVVLLLLLTKTGTLPALGKADAERDDANVRDVDADAGRLDALDTVADVELVLVASASAAAALARATARSNDSTSCTLGVAARIAAMCSSNARNQSPR
jgi:hypothetical protein